MTADYARVRARVLGVPLMVHPQKGEEIARGLLARIESGAPITVTPRMSPSLPGVMTEFGPVWPTYRVDDGVAILTIEGELVHKAMGAEPPSGFRTYPDIEADLARATADEKVRGVFIDMNSLGGECRDSAFQLGRAVQAAARVKPVWAMADEDMCSAAYLVAAGATKILMPPRGCVGSIGVYALHADFTAAAAKQGIKFTIVKAGARKTDGHPLETPPDAYWTEIQASIDDWYARFVAHVAEMRGMDEDAVRATEAAAYVIAEDAIAAGLIDEIATPEAALAALRAQVTAAGGAAAPAGVRSNPKPAAAAHPKGTKMSKAEGAPPNPADEEDKDKKDQGAKGEECPDCGKELAKGQKACAPGTSSAATKAAADARASERTRIAAIVGHAEAEGRGKLARHLAFETAMSAEDAAKMLAAAPKESAAKGGLAAAMPPNPAIGADAGTGGAAANPAADAVSAWMSTTGNKPAAIQR